MIVSRDQIRLESTSALGTSSIDQMSPVMRGAASFAVSCRTGNAIVSSTCNPGTSWTDCEPLSLQHESLFYGAKWT